MLQLVLLSSSLFINLTGRLWIVFAGEGASVVYSAAITAAGFTHELANTTTFEYVKAIIDLLMCPLCRPDGKVLIIGGGIGNFTNVTTTFKDHPCPHVLTHRTLYFRRGGFNLHVEGLKALCLLARRGTLQFGYLTFFWLSGRTWQLLSHCSLKYSTMDFFPTSYGCAGTSTCSALTWFGPAMLWRVYQRHSGLACAHYQVDSHNEKMVDLFEQYNNMSSGAGTTQ
ncbi:hypothetical protein BDR07DRAFT_1463812 [Suillus spraguei]|nr:hypothetical protein BDR07DRAFT_1463812 [Suillus spraguei]